MQDLAAMYSQLRDQAASLSQNFEPAATAAYEAWCKDGSCLDQQENELTSTAY